MLTVLGVILLVFAVFLGAFGVGGFACFSIFLSFDSDDIIAVVPNPASFENIPLSIPITIGISIDPFIPLKLRADDTIFLNISITSVLLSIITITPTNIYSPPIIGVKNDVIFDIVSIPLYIDKYVIAINIDIIINLFTLKTFSNDITMVFVCIEMNAKT